MNCTPANGVRLSRGFVRKIPRGTLGASMAFMSASHVVRCYEYVNLPYEAVRDALRKDPLGVFQRATAAATTRERALVSSLRVNVGSLEVGTDAVITVREITEDTFPTPHFLGSRTKLSLEWRAAKAPALFPSMKAELQIYPLSTDETQLDFSGRYEPPLGLLGEVGDLALGHRIAEACVHRFVEDIAARLRKEAA
jgi:hypothetical protein